MKTQDKEDMECLKVSSRFYFKSISIFFFMDEETVWKTRKFQFTFEDFLSLS